MLQHKTKEFPFELQSKSSPQKGRKRAKLLEAVSKTLRNVMLISPQSGGISMTFTNAFCIETIFETASSDLSTLQPVLD